MTSILSLTFVSIGRVGTSAYLFLGCWAAQQIVVSMEAEGEPRTHYYKYSYYRRKIGCRRNLHLSRYYLARPT